MLLLSKLFLYFVPFHFMKLDIRSYTRFGLKFTLSQRSRLLKNKLVEIFSSRTGGQYKMRMINLSAELDLLEKLVQKETNVVWHLYDRNVGLACLKESLEGCLRKKGIDPYKPWRTPDQYNCTSVPGCHCSQPRGNASSCLNCGFLKSETYQESMDYITTGLHHYFGSGCYETPENILRIRRSYRCRWLRNSQITYFKGFWNQASVDAQMNSRLEANLMKMRLIRDARREEEQRQAYLLNWNKRLFWQLKEISPDKAAMVDDIFQDLFSPISKRFAGHIRVIVPEDLLPVDQPNEVHGEESLHRLYGEAMKLRNRALTVQATYFAKIFNTHWDYYEYRLAQLAKQQWVFGETRVDVMQLKSAIEILEKRGLASSFEKDTVRRVESRLERNVKLAFDTGTYLSMPYRTPTREELQGEGLACLICGSLCCKVLHFHRTGHALFFDNSSPQLWSVNGSEPLKPTGTYPDIPEAKLNELWSEMTGRIVKELSERRQILQDRLLSLEKQMRERVEFIRDLDNNLSYCLDGALSDLKELLNRYRSTEKLAESNTEVERVVDEMAKVHLSGEDAKADVPSSCNDEENVTGCPSLDYLGDPASRTDSTERLLVPQSANTSTASQENEHVNEEYVEAESEAGTRESTGANAASQSVHDDSSSFEDSVESTTGTEVDDASSEEGTSSTSSLTDSSWDRAGETDDDRAANTEKSVGSGRGLLGKLLSFFH